MVADNRVMIPDTDEKQPQMDDANLGKKIRSNNVSFGLKMYTAALLLAVTINIFQFKVIEKNTIDMYSLYYSYTVLFRYKSAELFDVWKESIDSTVTFRRGIYLTLSRTMPSVNIVLPQTESLDIAQLYGLGRVNSVKQIDYDPHTYMADIELSDYIITGDKGSPTRGPGPYAIVAKTPSPTTLLLLKRDKTWYLVDVLLLPSQVEQGNY